MRGRAVFFDGLNCLLLTFLCFIYLGIHGFNIILISLGVVFGSVVGVAVGLTYISIIEKKGEIKVTLRTWHVMLGIFSIILGITIYVVFDLGPEVGLQLIRFVYPMGLSLVLGRLVLYLRWETKHEMRILVDGFIFPRVYAVPRSEGR